MHTHCFYGNQNNKRVIAGADPGFQVRGGAHLKKLRRAEGGAKIFGVFRVKNHDFTPKNHIFSIAEGGAKIFEVFRVKNHDFKPKYHIFSNFRGGGGARWVRPPPHESAPELVSYIMTRTRWWWGLFVLDQHVLLDLHSASLNRNNNPRPWTSRSTRAHYHDSSPCCFVLIL